MGPPAKTPPAIRLIAAWVITAMTVLVNTMPSWFPSTRHDGPRILLGLQWTMRADKDCQVIVGKLQGMNEHHVRLRLYIP
jgi:hypothetical protein